MQPSAAILRRGIKPVIKDISPSNGQTTGSNGHSRPLSEALKPTYSFRFDHRAVGLLLHPTSLPGPLGSGDIGAEARKFADFLQAAGVTWWQMLPVGPPGCGPGYSPYSSWSSFAGSAYLIDLQELVEEGLLDKRDLTPIAAMRAAKVNFAAVHRFREHRLHNAYRAFESQHDERHAEMQRFVEENDPWLADFSLFAALKEHYHGKAWTDWDEDLRTRKRSAMRAASEKLADSIRYHQFVQFVFDRQWTSLRKHCNDRGIGLIGDLPIFVGHDSADVWARPNLFALHRNGQPKYISGYPPDGFTPDGQRWGHPQYHWPAHAADGYQWWVQRFAALFKWFDAVRIDHFLGFDRLWQIPAAAPTAATGRWVDGPGAALFRAVRSALGDAPIIAEDLGILTPRAEKLRDQFHFPGMRVMQFGFGDSYHLPHRMTPNCVAYTGTHDNETVLGYFHKLLKRAGKDPDAARQVSKVRMYLGSNLHNVHWSMMRLAMSSVANTVVFPVQDLLGLDGGHRMNVPGTVAGNWNWRLQGGELTKHLSRKFRGMIEAFDRV